MHIGEVAARTELSLRSLRHWEDVGLIRPSGRTEGGFRLYTETDIDRIVAIRRMKPLGFSLEQMAVAMRDIETLTDPQAPPSASGRARSRLTDLLSEAAERRDRLRTQLVMAEEFITVLEQRLPSP